MRLNIFKAPSTEVDALRVKLLASNMEIIQEVDQNGWHGEFYYSTTPHPGSVPWAETFRTYFDEIGAPENLNFYAAFVFTNSDRCYVFSFGKAHFYLRPYCDFDFGIELAKRIANESDIRQTASRRFAGRRKKDIRSFTRNTVLDVESGESVDYLQAAILNVHHETFGKNGKFGSSALLSPDITPGDLGNFLDQLDAAMAQPARFPLPRTTTVSEPAEIERFDSMLLDEVASEKNTTDFTQNSYDLYGVDFVFASAGTFTISCPGSPKVTLDELSMGNLKDYIVGHAVARENILKIKIVHEQEGRPTHRTSLKEALDFIADEERVLLTNGRWMRFNQDYLDFLDAYLQSISVEETEAEFLDITMKEPEFNASNEIRLAGYETADKDYTIFKTRKPTPVEAWDLKRGLRVYAVKFATAQKLGYVCDQATLVLELLRNHAGVQQIPDFDSYCLWFGYRAKQPLTDISETGSIILKQKIETWARKCRDLGIEPVIKISRRVNPEYDS